jgi:hypothetical protein
MPGAEWKRHARARDFTVTDAAIDVRLPNARRHAVSVRADDDGYVLEAVIAGRRHTAAAFDDPVLTAWRRNRSSRIVGHRIDRHGRLVAHIWTPRAGLTAALFQTLVRTLAREADRQELLLTGSDRQ